MTEYVCTCDAICVEEKRAQFKANPQSAAALWNNLRQLLETISAEAVEIYRWNNDAQPQFSNGGVRMIIRLGRIDLA
jgi:hypothetical protein